MAAICGLAASRIGWTLVCWSDVRFNFSVRCPRPNAWPCAHPAPPGPGCAYTTTKPPSAIAPAVTSAKTFRFIVVCFIVVLLCAPRAFQNMTGCEDERLQNFLFIMQVVTALVSSAETCDRCLAQAPLQSKL